MSTKLLGILGCAAIVVAFFIFGPPEVFSRRREKPKPAQRRRGAIRDNCEAFAVAILMAVLLKYFCLEAYMIPTSSMQPTMMGEKSADVNDRILVDKARYEGFEPRRWDIFVFRYPIRQTQNYVKRCVGLPNDRLHIGAGNLYQVDADVADVLGDPSKLHVLRKPDVLQEELWREIYPARRKVVEYGNAQEGWGEWLFAPNWKQERDSYSVELAGTAKAKIEYPGTNAGGAILDFVWDGYPTDVARAMRSAYGNGAHERSPNETVQDVRISFQLECSEAPAEATIEIKVAMAQQGQKDRRFLLEAKEGKGRLEALLAKDEVVAAGEWFDLPLKGSARISFAHVDDRLICLRDGTKVASVDCDAAKIVSAIKENLASCKFEIKGGGKVTVSDPRVEYDQHYTTGNPGVGPSNLIVVPAGHYFMMGDNTRQSADSREWSTIEVGMLPDGRLVDPKAHPEAKVLVGNMRALPPSEAVDADENPVVLPSREMVAFTDNVGEVWALKSKIGTKYGTQVEKGGPPDVAFVEENGREWRPVSHKTSFVPREHILGRALMGFWPIWPLGPNRFGLIR